jgi:integrase
VLGGFYVDLLASGRKSFRLRYRLDKKTRILTIGDACILTAEEARLIALNFLKQGRQIVEPKPLEITFNGPLLQDFLTLQYLPYVESYKRSWRTDESMIRNHLIPKLGSKAMGKISPPDVAMFINYMKSEGYASGTCNRALVLLKYSFSLALRWKIIGLDTNPVKEIKTIKDDNKLERYLTEPQMKALTHAVQQCDNEVLQYIVLFLIYTGARKREVLDARWRDIDFAQRSWRIPKTKSSKVRHIPLSTGAVQVLTKLRDDIHENFLDDQFIFANPNTGKPFVSFFYSWNSARIRAGLPDFRIHDLRHSFASYLVNAGRSLYEVQELLGHADIKTTSRYAHLNRERLVAAVEVVPQIDISLQEPKTQAKTW